MEDEVAVKVLNGLLQRLKADAKRTTPQFESVVSDIERQALGHLITPLMAAISPQSVATESIHTVQAPTPSASIAINLDVTSVAVRPGDKHVVCIDFGTAKSKAFASKTAQYRDDEFSTSDLFDLGIGTLDGDLESAYAVESTIWIDDAGMMFAGARAMELSRDWTPKGRRERLDSIKQYLTLGVMDESSNQLLPREINPTQVELTYGAAACFFMAYLNDLVGIALESNGLSRYSLRRFTVPAWSEAKRKSAVRAISSHLKMSQILADTFRGRWSEGISLADYKAAFDKCQAYDNQLDHLLDQSTVVGEIGRSEPVAAGASRLLADPKLGRLVLLVDIGAGTTDFALLRIMPVNFGGNIAPITISTAVNFAGDRIDELLIEHILQKLSGNLPDGVEKNIIRKLRMDSIRRLKSRLFNDGQVEVRLANDHVVSLTSDEFIASSGIQSFGSQLAKHLQDFLSSVDESYKDLVDRPIIILSGGGAQLPFVRTLGDRDWIVASKTTKFIPPSRPIPPAFEKFTIVDRNQLAVAIGGAVSDVNEKSVRLKYEGALRPPDVSSGAKWV